MSKFFHIHRTEDVKSKYELIVFDDNKTVFLPLTDYYHYQINRISESSVITYLTALEMFFYWMKNTVAYRGRVVFWNDIPKAIQEAIRFYFVSKLNCKIRDKDSFEGIYVTKGSSKTVQVAISALKSFYQFAINTDIYQHANPLVGMDINNDYLDIKGVRKNKPRLSSLAGTEEPISNRRQTDTYFKIINNQWSPEIIGDFDLPFKIYRAGQEINWSLRDEIIIRIMFETGARISEILELTIGDYQNRRDIHEFSAINKGSYKKRIKFIRVSPETIKLLMRYVNLSRQQNILATQVQKDQEDDDYIFLNKYGNKYTYNAFYQSWCKLTKYAKIKLNPHKARHWFVTSMLREIYETSVNSAEIEQKKKQLIAYMKWRDPETLNIYEHYNDENKFRVLHEGLQATFATREEKFKQSSTKKKTTKINNKIVSIENSQENNWINDFYEGLEE